MIAALMFAANLVVSSPDCEAAKNRKAIEVTRKRIIKTARMPFFRIELPGPWLAKECVRFEFTISRSGKAENIQVVAHTQSRPLDSAAIQALEKYRFIPSKPGHEDDQFTLVFHIPKSWWKDMDNPHEGRGK